MLLKNLARSAGAGALVAGLLAGCGGTAQPAALEPQAPASSPEQPGSGHEHAMSHDHEEGEGHHHGFEGSIKEFHDVLAPRWHAQPGPERTKSTCDAAAQLASMARGIQSGPVPEAAQARSAEWQAAAARLSQTASDLEASCASEPTQFEASFHALHEAFHGVVEVLAPAAHHE